MRKWIMRSLPELMANTAPHGECMVWQGGCERGGYGSVQHNGETWKAHRLVFHLLNGQIPKGLDVMHTCDNPPCINPDHLMAGTRKDNVRDMMRKGRSGICVLTAKQVAEIRARYKARDPIDGARALGREFGVTGAAVGRIVRGETWAA